MSFFKKIFDHEYKELEKFKKIADEIMELEPSLTKGYISSKNNLENEANNKK